MCRGGGQADARDKREKNMVRVGVAKMSLVIIGYF